VAQSPDREEPGADDDLELIEGIEARDPSALEILFDRHAAGVFSACQRVAQNASDAEDVLETVFFEIWLHPERFDATRGSPRSYLQLLARSRALDLVRARSRAERRVREARQSAIADPGHADPAPLTDVLCRERHQSLRKAVDVLDARQRQVIEMAFFQGMTHAQVAQRLDLPLGTVKSRMRAGLQKLRRLLVHQDGEGGNGS